jgi:hypothetical protein
MVAARTDGGEVVTVLGCLLNGERGVSMNRVNIRAFRKLGGTWQPHRNGMGGWYYTGELEGHTYEVRAYAHFAPRFDGDDDSFEILWHTTRDGKPWAFATRYPAEQIMKARTTAWPTSGD